MEKSEFNERFGAFLRHKRNLKGWSQSRLASELGNNSQNISRIERGELSPTLFWISKLADAFEDELFVLIKEFHEFDQKTLKQF
jgi:ribosome-binding protein aMBF1 (putative translation factor)